MDTDAVASFEILNFAANSLDDAGDFMTKRQREFYRRNARAVMRVGMANAGGANADQDVARTNRRNLDPLLFQRRTDCGEANGFHATAAS
jgi:hypothetical protein